jgi:hypothetical protein
VYQLAKFVAATVKVAVLTSLPIDCATPPPLPQPATTSARDARTTAGTMRMPIQIGTRGIVLKLYRARAKAINAAAAAKQMPVATATRASGMRTFSDDERNWAPLNSADESSRNTRRASGEYAKQLADLVLPKRRMPHRRLGLHAVVIAAPVPQPDEITGVDEVVEDAMRLPLREPGTLGELAHRHIRSPRDLDQQQGVRSHEKPLASPPHGVQVRHDQSITAAHERAASGV